MPTLTGKFKGKIFSKDDFHIYYFQPDCRLQCVVTFNGQAPSIYSESYALYGDWKMVFPHGPRFNVKELTRYQIHKDGGNHYLKQIKNMLVA